MQNRQQPVATHKIIIFIVFICAAIIASLFVYHLRNQKNNVGNDNALIFPASREIKPFELISDHQQKFSLDNLQGHWTLLFFGFTHCATICPTTLVMLNQAYTTLHAAIPSIQIVLVSLDSERDTPEKVATYARSFNPMFIGVTGKIDELRKLQSQLGIYAARDNENNMNYQLQHTSSILLINPHGQWAGMFKYGMNPTQFSDAVIKNVRS